MELRLLSSNEELLIFSKADNPSGLIIIPGSEVTMVQGDFGSIVVDTITTGQFTIYHSLYDIRKDCTFYFSNDAPSLELHFMESNEMEYKLTELGNIRTNQNEFNLTYLPYIENITSFKGGYKYSTFDIHFSLEYLETFQQMHPLLYKFLNDTVRDRGLQYSTGKQRATADMLKIIHQILFPEFPVPIVFVYYETKAQELLMLSLKMLSIQSVTYQKPRSWDIDAIHEAERIIMMNLENPLSLMELAKRIGINDHKLKFLFKHVYGTTVFDYIAIKKAERAKLLVLSTQMSFADIAFEAGFKNVPNFNEAFKKKYRVTPTYMRKHK